MSANQPFQREEKTDDELLPFDSDSNDLPPPAVLGENEFLFIGEGLTISDFNDYVQSYDFGSILPDYVVLHHTAIPSASYASYPNSALWDAGETGISEAQRKQSRQRHLTGIKNVYAERPGWDRGPHLFVDDRYIWLFTPMCDVGIHAKQGNSFKDANGLHYSIGIEVIGYYEHVHWPEPVERLVGDCVAVLKQRLGTFDLHYKPWAGAISSHRDYNKPQCPGAAITEDYYIDVLKRGWSRLTAATPTSFMAAQSIPTQTAAAPAAVTPPAPPQTQAAPPAPPQAQAAPAIDVGAIVAESPIMASARATPEQCARYMLSRDHGEYSEHDIANVIVPAYFEVCAPVGVDPLVAIAQMIHETGNLTSWWAARPRRNPAGLGVNGQRATQQPTSGVWQRDDAEGCWKAGLAFESWREQAIVAHVGRLLAYALADEQRTPAQRDLATQALGYRALPANLQGSAPTIKQLGAAHNPTGQGWATPGTEYGAKLAELMRAILTMS